MSQDHTGSKVVICMCLIFSRLCTNLSTNIAYLKCLRLKFMILIVDLEIEIARWIYDYLNISSCKHFQSVLFFFLNIFCIKLAYLLTTSLTLRLRLKIVFSENTSWLQVLPCGPWNWDYKTYLRLPSLNISSCKRFQSVLLDFFLNVFLQTLNYQDSCSPLHARTSFF